MTKEVMPTYNVDIAFSDMERLADAVAKSNMFGMRTKEQALVLMAIAQAEGRHPALAARDYDVIQGRPAKKAEAMLRDFLQAGGKVEWHALTDVLAAATFTHPQTGSVRIEWDMARASTAGLTGKDNWRKHPRQMLRSRVVSEGIRTLWPLATSGMYVPEEITDFAGPTLDAKPEPVSERREAINADVPLRAAAKPMPRPPRVVGPDEAPPRTRTRRDFLDALRIALKDSQSAEETDRILTHQDVLDAKEQFRNGQLEELTSMIAEALQKWWHQPPEAPEAEPEMSLP